MQSVPVEVAETPPLQASVVWGTLDRSGDDAAGFGLPPHVLREPGRDSRASGFESFCKQTSAPRLFLRY